MSTDPAQGFFADDALRRAEARGFARAVEALRSDQALSRVAADGIYRADVDDETDLLVEDDYDRLARVTLAAAARALAEMGGEG